MTEKLRCPFCGDEPYDDETTFRIFGKRSGHEFVVACSGCEASAPGSHTIQAAWDMWNARAALAAAPQPAPEQGMTRAEVGQMLDAKRHDREALVRLLQIITRNGSLDDGRTLHEVIADALLARGLRLTGGDETMAWAVLGSDGRPMAGAIYSERKGAHRLRPHPQARMVRVAIRVVEGGDDAA